MLQSKASGEELPHPAGEMEGDRIELRRYVPGDPLRLILWKVYARTRQLMVRTPERAISPSLRILAYLPSTEKDEPASAAARVAVESGLLGEDWVFSADGAARPSGDVETALAMIVASERVRGTPDGDAGGLLRFLDSVEEKAKTRLILFLPGAPGPWLSRTVDALGRWGGSTSAILVTDGVTVEDPARRPYERWIRRPEPESIDQQGQTRWEDLAEVAGELSRAGATVIAIERPTGRSLSLGITGARRVA